MKIAKVMQGVRIMRFSKIYTDWQVKGAHRRKRPRKPMPGMMIHQDASTHEWVPGVLWDLVVTMDDDSAVFVEEEGAWSSFEGVRHVIETKGLFCTFYSDRGSHYWNTPEAGGKESFRQQKGDN